MIQPRSQRLSMRDPCWFFVILSGRLLDRVLPLTAASIGQNDMRCGQTHVGDGHIQNLAHNCVGAWTVAIFDGGH